MAYDALNYFDEALCSPLIVARDVQYVEYVHKFVDFGPIKKYDPAEEIKREQVHFNPSRNDIRVTIHFLIQMQRCY